MKLRYMSVVAASVLATASVFAASTSAAATAPTTQQDKLSYTIGVDLGKNLKTQDLNINADMLAQGARDALSGSQLQMTDQQMEETLKSFQQEMMTKQKAQFEKISADNAKAGEKFLADNKKQPGVVVLPNGLQYKVVKPGQGSSPTADDEVTVDYEGKLVNGTVFDSTYQRGKPASFKVSQVIPGWQQALKMMKPGAEWMLYIPANLAYGERGVGGPIGPNEALIFKVQLISVGGNAPASSSSAG